MPVAAPAPRRKNVHHIGADDRSSTRVRIVDATLACLARQGLAKTTVDDIARQAAELRPGSAPGGLPRVVVAHEGLTLAP